MRGSLVVKGLSNNNIELNGDVLMVVGRIICQRVVLWKWHFCHLNLKLDDECPSYTVKFTQVGKLDVFFCVESYKDYFN